MPANLEEDAIVTQQTTLEQRLEQARETATRLILTMPLLLDEMDNAAATAFAAWPERLVVAGADGRIAYPGSPGPWGFSPEDAEEQLVALIGGD
jgi:type I thyroxine 5'-deiodinase